MNDFKINPNYRQEMVAPQDELDELNEKLEGTYQGPIKEGGFTPLSTEERKTSKGEVIDWHKNKLDNLQRQIEDCKTRIKDLENVIDSKLVEADMLEQTLYHLEK